MAKSENIFKRYELKYLLSEEQYRLLKERLKDYIKPDEYKESTVCSLYYDTPQKVLIRRSLERPAYKEKLRLRSYGVAKGDTKVFVELKKKYGGIVYKRRVGMKCDEAEKYLNGKEKAKQTNQIKDEIDYFLKFYGDVEPSILLFYDRTAFVGCEDESLRITFDKNILYRENDLSLKKGVYGTRIIEEGQVLMELKVSHSIPLWLVHILNELKIYKTSFSKYGTAYCMSLKTEKLREERICG